MPFTKGHKINVGKICSKETREKIGNSNSKKRVEKICICGKNFSVWPSVKNQIYCSHSCAKIGKPTWNKGLKGYRAGKNHHWFGRDVTGEKNPSYIKDRTQLKKSDRKWKDSAYMDWVKRIKNRDNWVCRIADINCGGRLEAHHILDWINYPELRYEINNGITLCHAHHPRGRAKEKELSPYFVELVTSKE